jgi:hypothetical protein
MGGNVIARLFVRKAVAISPFKEEKIVSCD